MIRGVDSDLRAVLADLVDREQIDEVLDQVDLDEVAREWHRGSRMFSKDGPEPSDADAWAVALWMSDGWLSGPLERLRVGLLALVAAAEADEELGDVGAGPMENSLGYDETYLGWIEEQCTNSRRFRVAVSAMWVFARWPVEAALRVERAAGIRMARPVGWVGP